MKTQIENKEMIEAIKAIKASVKADAKASHATAWCLSRMILGGDTIDEAVKSFKDFVKADGKVDSKKASAIINASRHYVPFMVDHEERPLKVPALAYLKAVNGSSPSDAVGDFSTLQKEAVERATHDLQNEGVKPTLSLLREKVIENGKIMGEARNGKSKLETALAFINDASEPDLQALSVAISARFEAIKTNREKVARSL